MVCASIDSRCSTSRACETDRRMPFAVRAPGRELRCLDAEAARLAVYLLGGGAPLPAVAASLGDSYEFLMQNLVIRGVPLPYSTGNAWG
jgi:hypothetical protein